MNAPMNGSNNPIDRIAGLLERSIEKNAKKLSDEALRCRVSARILLDSPEWKSAKALLSVEQARELAEFGALSRQEEWLTARMGEREIQKEAKTRLVTSVSHAGGHVVVTGYSVGTGLFPGVDLERDSREVPEKVAGRVFHPEEREIGLSRLELWCVKEACLKAFHLSRGKAPHGQVIPEYRVTQFDPARKLGRVTDPVVCDFTVFHEAGYVVALAVHRVG